MLHVFLLQVHAGKTSISLSGAGPFVQHLLVLLYRLAEIALAVKLLSFAEKLVGGTVFCRRRRRREL
jgi:hypothetical protein